MAEELWTQVPPSISPSKSPPPRSSPYKSSRSKSSHSKASPNAKVDRSVLEAARERELVFYFEMRGMEYLETGPEGEAPPPARTERLLANITYRRRRCANKSEDLVETPKSFPGFGHRGRAYNAIVFGLTRMLQVERVRADGSDLDQPPSTRKMKMLSQPLPDEPDLTHTSVAALPPPQLFNFDPVERWRWELYDVDVQPSGWRYGYAAVDGFPFGLSELDVETLEWLQEAADANAHDERSNLGTAGERSWFGPADDAIVVCVASVAKRATAAVRLLRLGKNVTGGEGQQGLAYNEDGSRSFVRNHDPVWRPKNHDNKSPGDTEDVETAQDEVYDEDVQMYDIPDGVDKAVRKASLEAERSAKRAEEATGDRGAGQW